jgi:hypothetical protein
VTIGATARHRLSSPRPEEPGVLPADELVLGAQAHRTVALLLPVRLDLVAGGEELRDLGAVLGVLLGVERRLEGRGRAGESGRRAAGCDPGNRRLTRERRAAGCETQREEMTCLLLGLSDGAGFVGRLAPLLRACRVGAVLPEHLHGDAEREDTVVVAAVLRSRDSGSSRGTRTSPARPRRPVRATGSCAA